VKKIVPEKPQMLTAWSNDKHFSHFNPRFGIVEERLNKDFPLSSKLVEENPTQKFKCK